MAKTKTRKRTTTAVARKPAATQIVVRTQASAPARRAPARRSPIYVAQATASRFAPRRSSSSSGGGSSAGTKVRKGVAIAGAVLGYIDSKYQAEIQKLPALGGSRMITIALGLHFLARKRPGGMIDHAATAATAIAAYNFGNKGFSLAGPGDDGVARF